MRRDLKPLIYTVDGLAGRDAKTAEKRLSKISAEKWQRKLSKMVGFVRARMPLAVVRLYKLLLRGQQIIRGLMGILPVWECGAGVGLVGCWGT